MPKAAEEFSVTIKIKLEDGRELPWCRAQFRLIRKGGEYRSECVKNEFLMSREERFKYETIIHENIENQVSVFNQV